MHLPGMWIAGRGQPGLFIEARRFNYKRVVVLPMTDSVTIPGWIDIFRQRSPVGPDRTPFVVTLEELQHAAGSVDELYWRWHEHDARKTNRIALQDRFISASGC